jgi:hypothetical protein
MKFSAIILLLIAVIFLFFVISIIYYHKNAVVTLFKLYSNPLFVNGEPQTPLNNGKGRTMKSIMNDILLDYWKVGEKAFLFEYLRRNHFFLHNFFFLSSWFSSATLNEIDFYRYPLRMKHLLYGFGYCMSLLSLNLVFAMSFYNHRSSFFLLFECSSLSQVDCTSSSTSPSSGFSVQSISKEFCTWNDDNDHCDFHLSYEVSSFSYGILLIYFSFLLSLFLLPVQLLFFYLTSQLKTFYDFYLIVLTEKYKIQTNNSLRIMKMTNSENQDTRKNYNLTDDEKDGNTDRKEAEDIENHPLPTLYQSSSFQQKSLIKKRQNHQLSSASTAGNVTSSSILHDYNDELISLQSIKSIMLRGIRLTILQRKIDYLRPLEELSFLMNSSSSSSSKSSGTAHHQQLHFYHRAMPNSFNSSYNLLNYLQYRFAVFQFSCYSMSGNPHSIKQFLDHCYDNGTSSSSSSSSSLRYLILKQIIESREKAQSLCNELIQLSSEYPSLDSHFLEKEKDYYLLQWFLIYWFNGLTSQILKLQYQQWNEKRKEDFFLSSLYCLSPASASSSSSIASSGYHTSSSIRVPSMKNSQKCYYLFLFSVMTCLLGGELTFLSYFLFPFATRTFSTSSFMEDQSIFQFFVLICFLVFIVHIVLIVSCRCLLSSCFQMKIIEKSYLVVFNCFSKKMKYLLCKESHYLSDIFSTIQFFHPAIRLARLYPRSPVSRILMMITDNDLPTNGIERSLYSDRPFFFSALYSTFSSSSTSSYLIHSNIWNELNPLFFYRLKLLYENWKIRINYFIEKVFSFVLQSFRYFFHLLFLIPSHFQEVTIEGLLIVFFYGFVLVITISWKVGSYSGAVILIAMFLLICFIILNVSFGWLEKAYLWYVDSDYNENKKVAEFKKAQRKRRKMLRGIKPLKKVVPTSSFSSSSSAADDQGKVTKV